MFKQRFLKSWQYCHFLGNLSKLGAIKSKEAKGEGGSFEILAIKKFLEKLSTLIILER